MLPSTLHVGQSALLRRDSGTAGRLLSPTSHRIRRSAHVGASVVLRRASHAAGSAAGLISSASGEAFSADAKSGPGRSSYVPFAVSVASPRPSSEETPGRMLRREKMSPAPPLTAIDVKNFRGRDGLFSL